ncbi:hypothetical protein HanIR_Chr05g0218781 [Helianthus annuus]|nr:hypothetical protein HanIR_Chr05g0218781 [Helianthus annuus]
MYILPKKMKHFTMCGSDGTFSDFCFIVQSDKIARVLRTFYAQGYNGICLEKILLISLVQTTCD